MKSSVSKKSFPALSASRLALRRIEVRDADALHACFGNQEAMRYWSQPACKTSAETEKCLQWLGKTTSPYEHMAWAVELRPAGGCVGMVNYHHREALNRRLEIGYFIAPRHQRKRLGTEAVRAMVEYCEAELGVHRAQALIHPQNTSSIRLDEKLGFRCEGGPLADYWRVGERYLDVMVYARINQAASR